MIGAITDDDFDVNVLCFRLLPFELSIAKHVHASAFSTA
jgi:hypothetical protein